MVFFLCQLEIQLSSSLGYNIKLIVIHKAIGEGCEVFLKTQDNTLKNISSDDNLIKAIQTVHASQKNTIDSKIQPGDNKLTPIILESSFTPQTKFTFDKAIDQYQKNESILIKKEAFNKTNIPILDIPNPNHMSLLLGMPTNTDVTESLRQKNIKKEFGNQYPGNFSVTNEVGNQITDFFTRRGAVSLTERFTSQLKVAKQLYGTNIDTEYEKLYVNKGGEQNFHQGLTEDVKTNSIIETLLGDYNGQLEESNISPALYILSGNKAIFQMHANGTNKVMNIEGGKLSLRKSDTGKTIDNIINEISNDNSQYDKLINNMSDEIRRIPYNKTAFNGFFPKYYNDQGGEIIYGKKILVIIGEDGKLSYTQGGDKTKDQIFEDKDDKIRRALMRSAKENLEKILKENKDDKKKIIESLIPGEILKNTNKEEKYTIQQRDQNIFNNNFDYEYPSIVHYSTHFVYVDVKKNGIDLECTFINSSYDPDENERRKLDPNRDTLVLEYKKYCDEKGLVFKPNFQTQKEWIGRQLHNECGYFALFNSNRGFFNRIGIKFEDVKYVKDTKGEPLYFANSGNAKEIPNMKDYDNFMRKLVCVQSLLSSISITYYNFLEYHGVFHVKDVNHNFDMQKFHQEQILPIIENLCTKFVNDMSNDMSNDKKKFNFEKDIQEYTNAFYNQARTKVVGAVEENRQSFINANKENICNQIIDNCSRSLYFDNQVFDKEQYKKGENYEANRELYDKKLNKVIDGPTH